MSEGRQTGAWDGGSALNTAPNGASTISRCGFGTLRSCYPATRISRAPTITKRKACPLVRGCAQGESIHASAGFCFFFPPRGHPGGGGPPPPEVFARLPRHLGSYLAVPGDRELAGQLTDFKRNHPFWPSFPAHIGPLGFVQRTGIVSQVPGISKPKGTFARYLALDRRKTVKPLKRFCRRAETLDVQTGGIQLFSTAANAKAIPLGEKLAGRSGHMLLGHAESGPLYFQEGTQQKLTWPAASERAPDDTLIFGGHLMWRQGQMTLHVIYERGLTFMRVTADFQIALACLYARAATSAAVGFTGMLFTEAPTSEAWQQINNPLPPATRCTSAAVASAAAACPDRLGNVEHHNFARAH